MKNFKLLLATTAILSMGAMAAEAAFDSESENVDVKIEILKAHSLSNSVPLDFGRIVIDDTITTVSLNMNSSGVVTTDNAGAYILKQGTKGVIDGANCSQLSYPTATGTDDDPEIVFNHPLGEDGQARLSNIHCVDDDDATATFYGDITVSDYSKPATPIPAGIYTGSFTVTAIYPEQVADNGTDD